MVRALSACLIVSIACQKAPNPVNERPISLGSIARQARLAYRVSGGGFEASHTNWRAAASRDGALRFASASKPSASIELRTVGQAGEALVQRDGSLAIARHDSIETLRNTEAGVEQSWTFSHAPPGTADLEVRVRVGAHQLRASTESGLHFRDPATGAAVAYGVATWIDGDGHRFRVIPGFEAGEIVLRVPRAVVDASRFPATLDPLISPELDVDVPQPLEGASGLLVATARLGSGHVVVWAQASFSGFGVYAARIDADGTLAESGGALLASGAGMLQGVAVACGPSGCLAAFTQSGFGAPGRLFAVRLDPTGAPLEAPFLLPTSNTWPLGLVETFDGSGFVFAWADVQFSFSPIFGQTSVSRIFTLRVGTDGEPLDPNATLVATNEFGGDPALAIASNGAGSLIGWQRATGIWSSSGAETWATRLGPAGEVLDPGGFLAVANSSFFGRATPAAAASDGAGYLLLTVDSDVSAKLIATPIAADGPAPGPAQTLAMASFAGFDAALTFDAGQFVATWLQIDPVSFLFNTVVATLDATGQSSAPRAIPEFAFHSPSQKRLSGGAGLLLAWTEFVAGGRSALYASRVSSAPSLIDAPPRSLATSSPSESQVAAASNGTNYLVAWTEPGQSFGADIFASVLGASGQLVNPAPVLLGQAAAGPMQAAWDGQSYLVTWTDTGNPQRIRGLHLGPEGFPREFAPIEIAPPPTQTCFPGWCMFAQQSSPSLACAAQGCLIGWSENGAVLVSPTGLGPPGPSTTLATNPLAFGTPLSVATDGSGYLVSWAALQSPDSMTTAITAMPLDATGQPAAPPVQLGDGVFAPPAAAGSPEAFLVVWLQPVEGGGRVVASRVSSAGAALDAAPIPISTTMTFAVPPSVAWDGTRWLATWATDSGGATGMDIFAAYVGADGQPQAPFTLSAENADEWTPVLASNGGGSVLAAYTRFVASRPRAADTVRVRLVSNAPPPPSTCSADSDCASGHCSDGICCATACDGQCGSCAIPGHEGTCWPVVGQPVGGRPACAGAGGVCGGVCDGTQTFSCAYPDSATSCGAPTCSNGTATAGAFCDGSGGCAPAQARTCAPYACGELTCRAFCAANTDCADTAICGASACVPDTIAPLVTVSSLPPYTAIPSAMVLVSASDNRQLDRVLVFANEAQITSGAGTVNAALVPGLNRIRALAVDRAGNTAEAQVSTFLDMRPPRLAFTVPADGQAIGDLAFPVTIHVEDETPTTVSTGAASATTGGGDVQLLAQLPGDGNQTIFASATDSAGNSSTTAVPVLVDTAPPQVRIDLADALQLGPQPLDQIFVFTVERGISSAECIWSTGRTFSTPRGGADVGVWLPLHEGAQTLTVTCRNEVGREASDSRLIIYDTSGPSGAILSPMEAAWTRGVVEIAASASDDLTGVGSVRFSVDGAPPIAGTAIDGTWTALVDTSSLAAGAHVLVAILEDVVGNGSRLERVFSVDNVPPQVALDPLPQWVRGEITVGASATDDASGVVSVDLEVAGALVARCQASRCQASVDTAALGDGPFSVVAKARDVSGNDAVPAQATPSADNSAPARFLVSPAEGAIVTDTLHVAVNVVDGSFAQVTCSVERVALGASSDPAFQTDMDLHAFLDGPITTSCTATDLAGNSGTEHATVTLRRWTETLSPRTLRLSATSGTVSVLVEGPDVQILVPIGPRSLALRVPGGGRVPALDVAASAQVGDANGNGIADLTLKFDRALLVAALRSGVDAGAIDPAQPVTVQLLSGTRAVGSDQVQLVR